MKDGYIKNKRMIEKALSIYSIFFWIFNCVFFEISFNLLLKILMASQTDWFVEMIASGLKGDADYEIKTKIILTLIIVIIAIIIIFCVVLMILFRKTQIKNMLTQLGVLSVVGYDKYQLNKFCYRESLADIVIAYPVSVIISVMGLHLIKLNYNVSETLEFMNNTICIDCFAYIGCFFIVMITVILHTKYFVGASLKKGIRYMLGKGIV